MSGPTRSADRRRFLKHAGVFLVTGIGLSGSNTLVMPDLHAIAVELIKLLHFRDEARWVGRIYLKTHAPTASAETLTQALMQSMNFDVDNLTILPVSTLKSSLMEKVHRDYDEEHITFVKDWLISETEARLCAILYLEDREIG